MSYSPSDTFDLGEALGALSSSASAGPSGLCYGTVLLFGGVGAGKTVFAAGFARGFGARGPVTSPTYVIANTYDCPDGRVMHHFDAYRLDSPQGMEETGFWDYLGDQGCVVVVEWADRLHGAMAGEPRVEVIIRKVDADEGSRAITVRLSGAAFGCGERCGGAPMAGDVRCDMDPLGAGRYGGAPMADGERCGGSPMAGDVRCDMDPPCAGRYDGGIPPGGGADAHTGT